MQPATPTKLERAGFKAGSGDAFLGLTAAESKRVDIRLRLADALKPRRRAGGDCAALVQPRARTRQPPAG